MKRFQTTVDGGDPAHPGIALDAVPALVEAAVRADERDRAAEPFARFTRWATSTDAPELQALAARCRALLAGGDTAAEEFQRALDLHERTHWPMEQALTQLLFGEYLRRARRPTDARVHLRAALDTFHRLGTPAWADRARDELRATGDPTARRATSTLEALTPQELRIVTAVSSGATNREVAAQLFLSPRTIEYHLRKVFQRLGVSSRTELIRLVLTGDSHRFPCGPPYRPDRTGDFADSNMCGECLGSPGDNDRLARPGR